METTDFMDVIRRWPIGNSTYLLRVCCHAS
jgi:hypothetical protein